ncbi:hypothetical protein K1719_031194 [Acacia pycnantha]|nr:hypothetical protein K1719_031194 [Acacia pycnantha]
MEAIVTCIATKLAECLWDPILCHARYLFRFSKFIGDVEKAKGELEVKLADVNMRKEDADRRIEEIMPSVKKWLEEVNAILEEVQKQQEELEGGGNKCFNVSLRYSLAKQMEHKAKQMMELKSKSSFDLFSLPIQLPGINTQFSSEGVMNFKSRESTYHNLLKAIKDGKSKIVGLYGMGGSGKTTLAIEVGKKVEQLKLFHKVFKVVVSRPLNVRNIQKQIKEITGLKFEEETELAIAQRLSIGLRSMKVLIILDDVWSNLNLQEIGIPLAENCCILLTTRLRDVCDSMRCERTFELSLLTREEAWELLMMHANLTNDSFNEFDDVGRKIVDECKGLPIAIVIVGSAIRGKGIMEWTSTLKRLQHSLPLDVDQSSRGPFACLELSFDCLSSSLAKQLFLLCSMFPEDHEIHTEDLIRFAKGTLEFQGIAYTMEDARTEILVSINRLLDSCLLMQTHKPKCVKMHDLVRDVALWITKKQRQAILVDRTLVENETLKETKAISLWNLENNFKLSHQLHCSTLEILSLHSDEEFIKDFGVIESEGFIEDLGGIESLKVLALVTFSFEWKYYYRRWIQWSMPQSIVSSLMNLHTLCFRGIALGNISFLCHLIRLEILDLRGSQFDELPDGIVDMKKLKLLDVFGCQIKKKPLEVIQKCEQLEELYFLEKNSVIPENFSLSRLKRYAIYDSTSKNLHLTPDVHPYQVLDSCDEPLRALCIQGFKVSDLNSSMKDLILRANSLCLENCMWDHKGINVNIKHLWASNCPKKRFIVDSLGSDVLHTGQVFPHLITLNLIEMNSLERVFQDSSIICSLPMLQELYIKGCPELTTIFTHATNLSLPKLRTLHISGCNKVKWLFSYSLAVHCPSLEELRIESGYELERFFQEEVAHGDRLLHQRESHHDLPNYPYGNETERAFLVVTAKSFKQLQNHEALTLFLRLKHVKITRSGRRKKCMFEVQVRETIEGEESIEALEEPLKLNSELCSLDLTALAKLEYIWKGLTQSVNLHRLESICLWHCTKLRNIFTFAIVTNLPELRIIHVFNCTEWEGIFCEESLKNLSSSSNACFPKLQNIQIWKCNKVKRLFSYSLASHCPSLEELDIYDCSELESLDEEASYEDILLLLLKLKTLNLKSLPKLREIFGGRFEHKLESLHNKQECSSHKHKNERVKVVNLELISINLQGLPEWEYIWKGPTQSVSLHRLKRVKLRRCPKLRNIFTFAIVINLPELRTLEIYECEEWEGIFCEESLKNLSSFSSSNVCFPNLQNVDISECNKVKRLFSYSLGSHCPSLEKITIRDCSQLEGVFQAYEGEVAGHHEKLFPKLKVLDLKMLPKLKEIYPGYEFNHLSGDIQIEDCPNICVTSHNNTRHFETWRSNKKVKQTRP